MLLEISLLFGGIVIGGIMGTVLKKSSTNKTKHSLKSEKQEQNLPQNLILKFVSVQEYSDPEPLAEEVIEGKTMFIALEELTLVPYKKHQFLADLKKVSTEKDLLLKAVGQDMYLLARKDLPIEKDILIDEKNLEEVIEYN